MPESLARLVKQKYPGVYDDIEDADLDRRVRAKYPGVYDDIPAMYDSQPGDGGGTGAVPETGRLLGGRTTISAGEPEGLLSRGYGAVREAVFGDPEREEAAAAGIGLHPTAADLGRAAVGLGAAGAAGGGIIRGASALPGVAGALARPVAAGAAWLGRHPAVAGSVAAAADLAQGGDARSAAMEGLLVGAGAKGIGGALGSRMARVGQAAPRVVRPIKTPPRAAPPVAPAVRAAPPKPAASAAPKQASKRAPEAAKPAASTDKKPAPVSRGAAKAASHNALMQFAKGIAAKDPKVGEKIWILLDDAGKPVKMLTPDQAGAAARKGLQTTWVKNLWN